MVGRIILAVLFLVTGSLHFIKPQLYLEAMPPYLPWPLALIYISGFCEMLGAVGVLIPQTRHAAAWGLVALLIAVLPANFFMAMHPANFPGMPGWALWLRIPLQLPLILWVWMFTRPQA